MFKVKRIPFISGLVFGILIYLSFKSYSRYHKGNLKPYNYLRFNFTEPSNFTYLRWFNSQNLTREILSSEDVAYNRNLIFPESAFLQKSVTIYCIVLVRNEDYIETAKATWINGCNNYIFVNIATRKKYGKIAIKRTRDNSSWTLLCATLFSITGNYMWVLIVYENTFVVVENLRWFLAWQIASNDHYLGHSVEYWGTKYNTGEAGYVLSNSTLNKLRNSFNQSCDAKNVFLNKEDFYMGQSLARLNIFPVDTRDSSGYAIFHKYAWQHELFQSDFNFKSSIYPVLCCSSKSITFQVQSNNSMYLINYLLYKLKVFEFGDKGNRPFLNEVPDSVIWKRFLKEQGIVNMNVSSEEYYRIWQKYVRNPDNVNERLKENVNIRF